MGLNVKGVDASKRFLDQLAGVSDPEKKRKAIGRVFIEVFEAEANKLEGIGWFTYETIKRLVIANPQDEFIFLFDSRIFWKLFVYSSCYGDHDLL